MLYSVMRFSSGIRCGPQSDFGGPRPYLPNWAMLQRRLGGRMAQAAELDFSGRTLVVYNTHFESRGDVFLRLRQGERFWLTRKSMLPIH